MFGDKKGLGLGLESLFKSLIPNAKITIEYMDQEENTEVLVKEFVLVARTPTGELVVGSGDSSFLSGAAVRVLNHALKADQATLEASKTEKDTEDCSTCDMRSKCAAARPSK